MRYSEERIREFGIATPSALVNARKLSGGNQQKLVLARELGAEAALVLAEEPTQGLDVAATAFVHDSLLRVRESGNSVLLVSSSLDEILDLSDRIIVMYSGELMGILDSREATEQTVGALMMGIRASIPERL